MENAPMPPILPWAADEKAERELDDGPLVRGPSRSTRSATRYEQKQSLTRNDGAAGSWSMQKMSM
jgi:hypothetical protein